MAQAAHQAIMTVAEYMDVPETTAPYSQLIEGEFVMSPPTIRADEEIRRNIMRILDPYLDQAGIGEAYDASFGIYLNDINAFVPDVVFISNERGHKMSERGFDGTPDFVVEILSPSTARYDKGPKRIVYARCGVKELWLIDPKAKRIDVYYLQEQSEAPVASHGVTSKFTSPIFPGLEFSGEKIFAPSRLKQ